MADTLDIKYINPFLKATITVFELVGIAGGTIGKPSIKDLDFPANRFLIQVGVTGAMKGQVFFELEDAKAMSVASTMMMGMPVTSLDPMACSALQELGNMILGNTSTLFSTMNIIFDITPPLSMHGDKIKIQTEVPAISIPIMVNGEEHIRLYIAVTENKDVQK